MVKDYYEVDALNHSRLKLIDYGYNHFLNFEFNDSSRFSEGRAHHRYFLEPDSFEDVVPISKLLGWDKKTVVTYAKTVQEAQEKNPDILVVPDGEIERLEQFKKTQTKNAKKFLEGKPEFEVYKKMHNRKCKAKIDVLNDDFVTEFKTVGTYKDLFYNGGASIRYFTKYSYHSQLAFYNEIVDKFLDSYIVCLVYDIGEWVVFKVNDLVFTGYEKNKERFEKLKIYETFGYEGLHPEIIEI